jgi:hypothetical protein
LVALERTTAEQPLVRIPDGALEDSLSLLYRYHLDQGYFGSAFEGMSRERDIAPGVDLLINPQRASYAESTASGSGSQGPCALCQPTRPEQRGLAWRSYKIVPNEFPYVPPSGEHLMLLPLEHRGQAFDRQLLLDLIDLQRLDGRREEPIRALYNGISGSSQFHLHWHLLRDPLPIEALLEQGRLPLTSLRRGPGLDLSTFDEGFYSGILVEGEASAAVAATGRMVRGLETDPRTQGHYNLALLSPREGRARICIFPKQVGEPSARVGEKSVVFAALSLAGTVVLHAPLTPQDRPKLIEAARRTRVAPSELPWLEAAARGEPAFSSVDWS